MKSKQEKVIPALTKEARIERERFERAYQQMLSRANEIALSILVWGPNPNAETPVALKRRQIREELIGLGHNAMFSEELISLDDGLSEKTKEFAQALEAHLILILVEDSPGALAEAHDFCNHPKIAPKVYVLVPQKYQHGYSAQGALKDLESAFRGVYWYERKELKSCEVLTHSVKRAEALRHIYFRHQV